MILALQVVPTSVRTHLRAVLLLAPIVWLALVPVEEVVVAAVLEDPGALLSGVAQSNPTALGTYLRSHRVLTKTVDAGGDASSELAPLLSMVVGHRNFGR